MRAQDLEPWRIPKPYNTYHTDIVDNREAVLAAVRRVAGEPPKPETKPAPNLTEATLHEALALEHWRAIKASANPVRLRSFLNEFGDTKCAPLAQAELERLAALEWRKLAYSNDREALLRVSKDFIGTEPARFAAVMLAELSLSSAVNTGRSGQKEKFFERNASLVAILWFFGMVPLAITSEYTCQRNHWNYVNINSNPLLNEFASGIIPTFVLVIISELVIIKLRGQLSNPIAYTIYWFGTSLCLGLFVWVMWGILQMPDVFHIDPTPWTMGFVIGLVFFVGSGVAARIWWKARHRAQNTARCAASRAVAACA
ncbi:MAG: hypothetical protein ACLPWS_03855 [Rhodomicrobium sp.]